VATTSIFCRTYAGHYPHCDRTFSRTRIWLSQRFTFATQHLCYCLQRSVALLYHNLSAAIVDLSKPQWRANAIGIYRFWRNLGYAIDYAIGALVLSLLAYFTQDLTATFWVVGACMVASTAWLAAKG
jgi:hypothetical protein